MTNTKLTDKVETLSHMNSASTLEQGNGKISQFPIQRLEVPLEPTESPDDGTHRENVTPMRVDFETCPLWVLVDDLYEPQTREEDRRQHQEMDKASIDRFINIEKPQYMSVQSLWHELGGRGEFQRVSWQNHSQYFGTREMYTDPKRRDGIHGEMHQDGGRVPALVEVLGQLKKLNSLDMKVLHIAAAIHDMARENDLQDKDHGLRAAMNVDAGKNYLATYRERGMTFTPEEVQLIKILCVYHEKSWEVVPSEYKENQRIATLIQTLQAADALDRFRSPNKRWYPKPEYFMRFFDNDAHKIDAAFAFAKYFALMSEKYRLEENVSAEEAMHYMLEHIGFLKETIPTPSLRRQTYDGGFR